MERLPKDVRELISKELSIRDFLNYCTSTSDMCSDDIWRRRAEKDYQYLIRYVNINNTYKQKYLYITKVIFNFIDTLWNIFFKRILLANKPNQQQFNQLESFRKEGLFSYIIKVFTIPRTESELNAKLNSDMLEKQVDYIKYDYDIVDYTPKLLQHNFIRLARELNMLL